jgi:Zn-dependent peptidase ImmA (M78 family)
MNPERGQEISGLAEAVAEMYCSSSTSVSPTEIAQAVGVTYCAGKYGDCFDGLLEYKSRRFHIYLNRDLGNDPESSRGRFTFCHELGHFCLEEHRWALARQGMAPHGSLTDFRSDNDAEREADTFASNLLLPSERVRKLVGTSRVDARLIVETARRFEASLSATAIRMTRLGISPVIVMAWDGDYRRWCWSSPDFESITRNLSHRSLDKIPSDSLTRKRIQQGLLSEGALDAKGTTLATWFPRVNASSSNNMIMIEEVIGMGSYGVMTVLTPDTR